jgi:LysR family hydrogen peroxide-inducible transcriptional activator
MESRNIQLAWPPVAVRAHARAASDRALAFSLGGFGCQQVIGHCGPLGFASAIRGSFSGCAGARFVPTLAAPWAGRRHKVNSILLARMIRKLMTDITLRQMRYFDALARHLNFGRAAAECAVTQPALSMQIADFEAKLGISLVDRTRQRTALTEAGERAVKRIRRVLGEIHDLVEEAQSHRQPANGPLKFGVIPSVAPYLLPRLLPHFRRSHPQLRLHLRETLTRSLVSELLDGRLDLVLLALPLEEVGIETLPLFEDPFLLAVPNDHPAEKVPAKVEEIIACENLLLLEEGHCLREQALSYCGGRQSQSLNTLGVSSISTIVQMVGNGYGVTLLPELAATVELQHSNVTLVQFAPPAPHRVIGLAWRENSPHKPNFVAYGQLIQACVGRGLHGDNAQAAAPGVERGHAAKDLATRRRSRSKTAPRPIMRGQRGR